MSASSRQKSVRTKTNGKVKDEAAAEHLQRSVGNLVMASQAIELVEHTPVIGATAIVIY